MDSEHSTGQSASSSPEEEKRHGQGSESGVGSPGATQAATKDPLGEAVLAVSNEPGIAFFLLRTKTGSTRCYKKKKKKKKKSVMRLHKLLGLSS